MRLHIFAWESDYGYKFLNFLEANFNIEKDIFIFRLRRGNYKYSKALSDKILFIDTKYKLIFFLLPKLLKSDTIFYHYFPIGLSLFFWFFCLPLLKMKKLIWIIWGGDLYFYKDKPTGVKYSIFEWLRKKIIKHIDIIICLARGDYDLARKVYNTNAKYYYGFYPFPVNFSYLESIRQKSLKKDGVKIILLGNSADPGNRHLEVLKNLEQFKNENLKIICPLSYGETDSEYVKEIFEYGSLIFNKKFVPILDYYTQNEYAKILSEVDIAIMNHNRQQGFGTIYTLLFLGKKVFLRDDVTSFTFFSELGIEVFDTKVISNITFEKLFEFRRSLGQTNYEIIKEEISDQHLTKLWSSFFAK